MRVCVSADGGKRALPTNMQGLNGPSFLLHEAVHKLDYFFGGTTNPKFHQAHIIKQAIFPLPTFLCFFLCGGRQRKKFAAGDFMDTITTRVT